MPDDLARVNLPHRPDDYSVWDQLDVARLVAQVLPGPVHMENDAAAAAMGELQLGHGLRARSFVYLLISAGLGGGLVIDGAYFRGAHGRSGEIGFLPLASRRDEARSLQDLVSLAALYDHLRARGAKASTPGELLRLNQAGREALDQWLDHAADALCEPLLVLGCAIDPEAILVGGRLPEEIVDDLCERLNARLAARGQDLPAATPVLRAALAADASAMGAAILPFSDRFLPTRSALLKTAEG
jgi:predicted NBD/HSP70 family sugar kinase